MTFDLKKITCPHKCLKLLNYTKGLFKHYGFVLNFEHSRKKIDNLNDCVPTWFYSIGVHVQLF
jgi:hypothetical protein